MPGDICILDIRSAQLEQFRQEWRYGVYEQWFLAFAPGHPYLLYMINRMVRSIQARLIPIPFRIPDGGNILGGVITKQSILRVTGTVTSSA